MYATVQMAISSLYEGHEWSYEGETWVAKETLGGQERKDVEPITEDSYRQWAGPVQKGHIHHTWQAYRVHSSLLVLSYEHDMP